MNDRKSPAVEVGCRSGWERGKTADSRQASPDPGLRRRSESAYFLAGASFFSSLGLGWTIPEARALAASSLASLAAFRAASRSVCAFLRASIRCSSALRNASSLCSGGTKPASCAAGALESLGAGAAAGAGPGAGFASADFETAGALAGSSEKPACGMETASPNAVMRPNSFFTSDSFPSVYQVYHAGINFGFLSRFLSFRAAGFCDPDHRKSRTGVLL